MPHNNDDLFILVKSLSASEWAIIHNELGEDKYYKGKRKNSNGKLTYQLILLLAKQKDFDDLKIKEKLAFGTDRKEQIRYANVKHNAIEAIYRAFERAPKNQTDDSRLHKLPILLDKLIGLGLYQRADRLLDRSLKAAREQEFFGHVLTLIKYKLHIASVLSPPQQAIEKIESLSAEHSSMLERYTELEKLNSLKEMIWLMSKSTHPGKRDAIVQLFEENHFEEKQLLSTRAKYQFLYIKKRVLFYKGENEGWVKSIQQIRQMYSDSTFLSNDLHAQKIFIGCSFALSQYLLLNHEFPKVKALIQEMAALGEQMEAYGKTLIQEKVLLAEIFYHRAKLNWNDCHEKASEIINWYRSHPGLQDGREYGKIAAVCMEFYLIQGKGKEAMQWIRRLQSSNPSNYNPQITAISWVLGLICRVTQNDFENLKYDQKAFKRYLTGHLPENRFYKLFFEFGERFLKNGSLEGQTKLFLDLQHQLDEVFDLPGYAPIENYFPFRLWTQSKISSESLESLVISETKPQTGF